MRKLLFALFILLTILSKAQTVSPDSAKYHEGILTTVCGTITSGRVDQSETVFLNFGPIYPDNCFTAVIFAKDSVNFKERKPSQFLKEKNICVTGLIKMNKGKPEIIIRSQYQIKFPEK